ncbi:hypothetical protein ACVWZ8_004877 [Arthrobacter sp. UYCu723]
MQATFSVRAAIFRRPHPELPPVCPCVNFRADPPQTPISLHSQSDALIPGPYPPDFRRKLLGPPIQAILRCRTTVGRHMTGPPNLDSWLSPESFVSAAHRPGASRGVGCLPERAHRMAVASVVQTTSDIPCSRLLKMTTTFDPSAPAFRASTEGCRTAKGSMNRWQRTPAARPARGSLPRKAGDPPKADISEVEPLLRASALNVARRAQDQGVAVLAEPPAEFARHKHGGKGRCDGMDRQAISDAAFEREYCLAQAEGQGRGRGRRLATIHIRNVSFLLEWVFLFTNPCVLICLGRRTLSASDL